MSDLLAGRTLMADAEKKIRRCLEGKSPGETSSELLREYQLLFAPEERDAFVAVLATHVAISAYKARAA